MIVFRGVGRDPPSLCRVLPVLTTSRRTGAAYLYNTDREHLSAAAGEGHLVAAGFHKGPGPTTAFLLSPRCNPLSL